MSIHQWPVNERPREKLLQHGPAALSEAELLAIFLRTGRKGKTAVDVGRELLLHFGSLHKLLTASCKEVCQLPGLGPTKYVQLQACLELGNRYLAEQMEVRDVLVNPVYTHAYLQNKLSGKEQEVFACLFLNSQNEVLAYKELFHGTLSSSVVYPREVVKQALKYNASSVIFSHNHPSGNIKPSEADKIVTTQLQEALAVVDIKVLDHIIIGKGKTFSFAQKALL